MATLKRNKSQQVTYQDKVRRIIEKQKPIVGIDIGSSSIKMVSMKKNHELDKWGLESVPIGMINQGKIEAKEPLVKIIKKALKTYKIRTKDCALYLSSNELIIREFTLPEMNDTQIRENIKQEIYSMLPKDHEEYYIDYKVVEYIKNELDEEGQFRVLAAAAPVKLLFDYLDTLKKAGLKVRYIDVLPNIGGKICDLLYQKESNNKPQNICMIDFGSSKTEVIIYKEGNYSLSKTINSGGDYLTSVISKATNMDEIDAEDFKCTNNLFELDKETQIAIQVDDYFDYLTRDFGRTMEFYKNRNQESIDKLYIMGGGSLLAGLQEYLEEQLEIEVRQVGEIFDDLIQVGAGGSHISVFSQAIGVTYREEWNHEG